MTQSSRGPEKGRYHDGYYHNAQKETSRYYPRDREHQYSERRGESNRQRNGYPRSKAHMSYQTRDSARDYRPPLDQEKVRHASLQWRPRTESSAHKAKEPPQNFAEPRMEEASSSPLLQNPPVKGGSPSERSAS